MKELYFADQSRYDNGMEYERCGRSGVLLPKVSLGFWHNFGSVDPYERSREITHYAFDHGITHFDSSSPQKLATICGLDLMVTGEAGNI